MSDHWDAETYEKVSVVQLTWGQRVIRRRKWRGNEIVMDAGAGSGALARIFSSILPYGSVYAPDNDPNISRARLYFARHKNVEVIQSRRACLVAATARCDFFERGTAMAAVSPTSLWKL